MGYTLFYVSADAPDSGAWSVYQEEYLDRNAHEPVDGSSVHVSTHGCESEAVAAARRLQVRGVQ